MSQPAVALASNHITRKQGRCLHASSLSMAPCPGGGHAPLATARRRARPMHAIKQPTNQPPSLSVSKPGYVRCTQPRPSTSLT